MVTAIEEGEGEELDAGDGGGEGGGYAKQNI